MKNYAPVPFRSLGFCAKALLFALLILSNNNLQAQFQQPDINMPSPNAASLGLYGEVPVSQYTGVPNIEIPIYTVEEGKIKVPISLSYHASGVRPNQHPGWVGMNWNLNAGGAITRTQKGLADELGSHLYSAAEGFYKNPGVLASSDWDQASKIGTYRHSVDSTDDFQPDVFSFNFLSYSGKFYLNHLGEWVVQSNDAIKVLVMAPLIPIPGDLNLPYEAPHDWVYNTQGFINTFSGFILFTPDGMSYHFGGETSAIEYSKNFFNQKVENWVATTWNLKKIVSPEGSEVTFTYETKPYDDGQYIANIYPSFGYVGTTRLQSNGTTRCIQNGDFGAITEAGFYSGSLIRPVYLKQIDFKKGKVVLNSSKSTELRYPLRLFEDFAFYSDTHGPAINGYSWFPHLYSTDMAFSPCDPCSYTTAITTVLDELQWMKLDGISVFDKKTNSKTFDFSLSYNNNSSERLMLTDFKILSKDNSSCLSKYSFDYHYKEEHKLPDYCDAGDQTDQWGFFNKNYYSLNNLSNGNYTNFENHKAASDNLEVLQQGSLRKITYPTGGTTELTYERHSSYKAQKFHTDGSIALEDESSMNIGGLRIAKITSKVGDDTIKETSYSYKFGNYSSGILSGKHQFYWPSYTIIQGEYRYTKENVFSYQNLLPAGTNANGSHIGYREVKETNRDNSYKIYKFTNYESEDGTHLDGAIPSSSRLTDVGARYDEKIDKSLERGKLLEESTHNSTGRLLLTRSYKYKALPKDFIRSVKISSSKPCPQQGHFINEGHAFKYLTYQYKPSSEYVYEYTEDGSNTNFKLDSTQYVYNIIGLPSEVTTWRNGKMKMTKNKYVSDYSGSPTSSNYQGLTVLALKAGNRDGLIVEQQQWNNDNGNNGMVDGYINFYRLYSGVPNFFNIQVEKTLRFASIVPVTNILLSSTSSGGNFTYDETYYTDTTIDFGTSSTEGYTINGEPQKFTTSDGILQNYSWGTGNETGLLKSKTLGDETTSFTYDNPLVGVSTITDPKGMVTKYYYDNFNRLAEIKELHDFQEYLIQSFNYNLSNSSGCSQPSLQNTNATNVLIVGNSITKLMAQASPDGWRSDALIAAGGWGRASSTQEKDFSHILQSRFKQLDSNAQVLPLWEASFERDYVNSESAGWLSYDYGALQSRISNGFGSSSVKPDLVIIRLGENVLNSDVESKNFKGALNTLIDRVLEVSTADARVILTNSMWPDQPLADAKIQEVASERGYPFVDLSDMISNSIYLAGNDPASLAAFPNNTGDRHPGDAGMLEIADRIWSKIQNFDLPSNIGGNITKARLHPRTDCCSDNIVGSAIQGSNDLSNANGWTTLATINETPISGWNEYAIRTTTAWRYLRFLAGPNCSGELKELEFYNGNTKLTGSAFGSSTTFNNDTTNYGYRIALDNLVDAKFWRGSAPGSQNYAGLDLGVGCSALTGVVVSPMDNATIAGTASTITAGRVTTAISINVCAPIGSAINSVEVWAATSTGGYANRMGYAVADPSQPGVYTLSAQEGSEDGKWPIPYLAPNAYRFYAVINAGSSTFTTDYITITLTEPTGTTCPVLTGSVSSPGDNATVEGIASATTAGRVTTAISVSACAPTGFAISSVEVWAATSTGGFPNRMGYAVANPNQPGVYTLSAQEGSEDGKWPIAYLAPNAYRFYAVINSGSSIFTTDYITIDLTEPTGVDCPVLTGSVSSPGNNATVEGIASATTAGRVTTAISVNTCVPTGFNISSVEVWATTSTGGFPNRMGYAVADPGQPGVYTLSAQEGSEDGKWPIPYLAPNAYRFYAVINSGSSTFTTDYITITLTEPTGTTCPALTGIVSSPGNNASIAGTASTITAGRVTTAISVNACAPTGLTISSVEIWAATSTGGFANRMGYAVADPSQPGVYTLSAQEGSEDGKWPIPYLAPNTYRFYAVVNAGSSTYTTDYITITLTEPTGTTCPVLAGSLIFPSNNSTIAGTASTTTAGRVTTAISVNACAPTGLTISSVEIWAATSTGGFANRMGYAVADPGQPGTYTLSAQEGSEDGKWPIPHLAPNAYRFYAVINAGTSSSTTDYITINLTGPTGTCSALSGSVVSPVNNATVVGTGSTTTSGRVTTEISVNTCAPSGLTIGSVEIWAATSTGGFPNRMGYAVANPSQPGVYTLSAQEGSEDGKWPVPYLAPNTYRFYAVINAGTSSFTTDYITINLTEPTGTCSALTGSVVSPVNNAGVVGTPSTTTTGQVTTAISVNACAPTGLTISSVEVWAATSTGGFATRMGYAVANPSQPGIYTLSAQEGSEDGKWPIPYLAPNTYRFYAVIKAGVSSFTTDYVSITLTAPPITSCSALTGSVMSPANNVSVVGTASTTTTGRVITAISINACTPSGSTISSVEVWAATSTGGFATRMGYAVADPGQPGVYKLSSQEGSEDGKWPIPYLDPNTYRFYAVINNGTSTFTTDYIMLTMTAP